MGGWIPVILRLLGLEASPGAEATPVPPIALTWEPPASVDLTWEPPATIELTWDLHND